MTTPSESESGITSVQRYGVIAILTTVLVFAIWIALAPLNSAVVAIGLVKAATNRKLVQHTEGGVIKSVLVRNGDTVKQGQPLLELEDVKIDASQQMLIEMALLETLKSDRLDAEQQLAPRFALPNSNRHGVAPNLIDKAYHRELAIFRTRRSLLDEQLTSYRKQLNAITEEQLALRRQMEASRDAAQLAQNELGLNESLLDEKFISPARVIVLRRALAEYAAKQGEHEALFAQSEQRKSDLALRMASARAEYQRVAAEEFKESNARLIQLREQLRPVEDAAQRKMVVAPVSGKVVGLRVNASGEVAPPREPLMEIVPDNETLIVEASVGVDAIKHLRLDQPTELRFTTYNSRTTPLVAGRVTYVSADAMLDRNGAPHYIIHVLPNPESLKNAGIPLLRPGMAAEVFVLIEARSVINYLLTPITDTLRRTMREP